MKKQQQKNKLKYKKLIEKLKYQKKISFCCGLESKLTKDNPTELYADIIQDAETLTVDSYTLTYRWKAGPKSQ